MRFTFIPSDNLAIVDGIARHLPGIEAPPDVHAVQWHGEAGAVEYRMAADGTKPPNARITSLDDWQYVLDAWAALDPEIPEVPETPEGPAVPASISRRQLLLGLVSAGLITGEEALAAATTGAVPAAIDAVFAALPEADALAARITWATMSVVERAHPLIAALIAAEVATPEQVDALFIAAASR